MLSIKIKLPTDLSKKLKQASELQVELKRKQLVDKLKEATPVDTGEARNGWRLEGTKIVNDVDHISDLNAGSSDQAPLHFVEKTLLEDPDVSANGTIVEYK